MLISRAVMNTEKPAPECPGGTELRIRILPPRFCTIALAKLQSYNFVVDQEDYAISPLCYHSPTLLSSSSTYGNRPRAQRVSPRLLISIRRDLLGTALQPRRVFPASGHTRRHPAPQRKARS